SLCSCRSPLCRRLQRRRLRSARVARDDAPDGGIHVGRRRPAQDQLCRSTAARLRTSAAKAASFIDSRLISTFADAPSIAQWAQARDGVTELTLILKVRLLPP